MCNRSTLSNTHYLPSGYLSHDRNITSSSGTTTASWTAKLLCEVDVSQQVSRLHMDLNSLLLHPGLMDALQDSLHVLFQLGPLRHQPPPAMYFGDGRRVFETTYQGVRLCTMGIVHPEQV